MFYRIIGLDILITTPSWKEQVGPHLLVYILKTIKMLIFPFKKIKIKIAEKRGMKKEFHALLYIIKKETTKQHPL